MKNYENNSLYFDDKVINFDYLIDKVVPFENIYLVLLDPKSPKKGWGQFPNLYAFDKKGNQLWIAELPTSKTGECYRYLDINDKKINAYSACSCHECFIDPLTGKIIEKIFTK